MEEQPRHQQHRGGNKQVLELPQWNSKFGFAAQKKNPTQQPPAGVKGPLQATPGRLGQARRVPVAAGSGGAAAAPAAKHGQENQGPPCAAAPGKAAATPQDAEKTPTLCLFERFERLTLVTPSTAAPNTAATGAGLGRSCLLSSAPKSGPGSAGSTTSSTGSEQCVARVKPARHSVAFGTPSVLAYTPAQPMRHEAADCQGDEDRTPLWSNAGCTPYSLPGSSGSSGHILDELCPEQEEEHQEEEGSSDSTALPLITASGIPRVCAGSSNGRHSSGVRMELFTSVIHEVTEEEGQVTPAGTATLRCPQTPLDVVPVPAGGAPVVEQADSTGAGAHAMDAAGGPMGSDCDEGSECNMELLTPASLPLSARLQRAAAGGSTMTKNKPASSSKPTDLRMPAVRSAATAAGERAAAAKTTRAGAASRGGGGAAAAGVDAGSPSGISSFTGFAGGAPAEQQAGSTTPTFFDGSRRAGCGSKAAAASSSLQNLLAGSSTATSGATPPAPASAARVGASRGAARAQAPVWVPAGAPGSSKRTPARTPVAKLSSSRAAAATPATGQRPQRTPAAAAGPSAAKAASSRAAVTPGTRQQRTLNFGAAAAERGPAAVAAAACASAASSSSAAAGAAAVGSDDAEVFSSPPASMRPPPAMTPKSKLRQPERVVLEAHTPKPTAELHKLLDDADAAAAAAAVLAAGAGQQQEQAMLVGSCEVLSPVRARKHAQHTLGASEQVCTPVRRSARKLRVTGGMAGGATALVGGGVLGGAPGAAAVVQPMLEATNYCYQPNEALQK